MSPSLTHTGIHHMSRGGSAAVNLTISVYKRQHFLQSHLTADVYMVVNRKGQAGASRSALARRRNFQHFNTMQPFLCARLSPEAAFAKSLVWVYDYVRLSVCLPFFCQICFAARSSLVLAGFSSTHAGESFFFPSCSLRLSGTRDGGATSIAHSWWLIDAELPIHETHYK